MSWKLSTTSGLSSAIRIRLFFRSGEDEGPADGLVSSSAAYLSEHVENFGEHWRRDADAIIADGDSGGCPIAFRRQPDGSATFWPFAVFGSIMQKIGENLRQAN